MGADSTPLQPLVWGLCPPRTAAIRLRSRARPHGTPALAGMIGFTRNIADHQHLQSPGAEMFRQPSAMRTIRRND